MTYVLPNPNLFTTTNAGKKELNGQFQLVTSWCNDLLSQIVAVESEGIAGTTDTSNVDKVPVTDGTNITWKKINADLMASKFLSSEQMVVGGILQESLADGSIGTAELIDKNVTLAKIQDLAANSIIATSLAGRVNPITGDPHTILGLNNSSAPSFNKLIESNHSDLSISTRVIQNLAITDAKIATVDGSKLINDSVDFSKLKDANIPATKISSAGTTTGYPLIAKDDNAAAFAQVTTVGIANGAITMAKLDQTLNKVVTTVIAAASIAITNYDPVLSYGFGIASVTYVAQSGTSYVVTFDKTYTNPPIVSAMTSTYNATVTISAVTTNSITIRLYPQNGYGGNATVHLQAMAV